MKRISKNNSSIAFIILFSFLFSFLLTSCITTKEMMREEYKQKGWDDRTIETVLSGRIFPGMTKEQVRAGWGRPTTINKTSFIGRPRREQWVYRGSSASNYVYFEGDICYSVSS